jgi:hypothetical protein
MNHRHHHHCQYSTTIVTPTAITTPTAIATAHTQQADCANELKARDVKGGVALGAAVKGGEEGEG